LATDFVLDALEQAIDDRCGTNVQDLIHHSDRGGTRYLSMRYSERLAEAGIAPSVGSRGDSYDAMAEWIIGLFKTEVIQRKGPWRHLEAVEFATLGWVLLQYAPAPRAHRLRPAAEYDAQYYAQRMPTPPLIQLHGGALVGSHLPTTALTGRPSSARMTFFDD
jgi:transposase InsO family protein